MNIIAQTFDLTQNGQIGIKRTAGKTAGIEVLFNIKTEQDKKGRQKRKIYRQKEGRWTKLGFVEDGKVQLSFGKQWDRPSQLYAAILNEPTRYNGFEFRHKAYCQRCNRELTDPTSVQRGIGPECLKNI